MRVAKIGRPSPLEDPVARRLVLQLICLGESQDVAGKEAGSSGKGVQRWARKDPVFKERLVRARQLRGSNDLDAIAELLGPTLVEVPEVDPEPPVELVPARVVVEGEVLGAPARGSSDDELLVEGAPAFNRRNLLAFCWRAIHKSETPAGVISTCIRVLDEDHRVRERRRASIRLDHAPERAKTAAREKGLSADVVWGVRRALIGPPPGDDDRAA